MRIRRATAWGAAIGLCIGACLGGGLLFLGQDRFGSEAMEGAMMLGMIVAFPLSAILGLRFDWGGYADQWTVFLAVAPAANAVLLGAASGFVLALLRRPTGPKPRAGR